MKVEIIRRNKGDVSVEQNLENMEDGKLSSDTLNEIDTKKSDSNIDSININIIPQIPDITIKKDKTNDKLYNYNQSKKDDINKVEINEVYPEKLNKVSPLMRKTSFQARLGKRLDKISQKIIDNQIRLTSHPTDMIRIKSTRDPRSQDLISRTVIAAEIVPIILPVMEDIPMRKLIRQGGKEILIPSLYPTSETTYYELYSPLEVSLDEDDLLLRIIEDPLLSEPYVLCLQVKEILGTLGYSSFRYQKFWASLYDESLPNEIIEILKRAQKTRDNDHLGW